MHPNRMHSSSAVYRAGSFDPENPPLDEIVLEPRLLDLVRLRVALIHKCRPCFDSHLESLRNHGESEERVRQLISWRESSLYNGTERAALALADALAAEPGAPIPKNLVRDARKHFNDAEILHLVLTIFAANDWNSQAIHDCGAPHRPRKILRFPDPDII